MLVKHPNSDDSVTSTRVAARSSTVSTLFTDIVGLHNSAHTTQTKTLLMSMCKRQTGNFRELSRTKRHSNTTRKLSYRNDDRAMRPIYECPKMSGVPNYAHGYFSEILLDFCSDKPLNVPAKFEVRSFIRSWHNSDWCFSRACEPLILGRKRQ